LTTETKTFGRHGGSWQEGRKLTGDGEIALADLQALFEWRTG